VEERSRRWIAGAAIAVPILFLVIQKASINAASMQPEPARKGKAVAAAKPASAASAAASSPAFNLAAFDVLAVPGSMAASAPGCLRKPGADPLALASPADNRRVMERMNRSLVASGDVRLSAVAGMLDVSGRGMSEIVEAMERGEKACTGGKASETSSACREARESLAAARAHRGELLAPVAEKLARTARDGKDPLVYAMAMQACRPSLADASMPACDQLSAEQWARLDPDNGIAWMKMLEEAMARSDLGTASEALHRLSQARRIESPGLALTQLVLRHLPADLKGEERLFAVMQSSAVWMQWQVPGYQPLVKMCSPQAVRDANRAQTCEAVAHLLVERDQSALGNMIGLRLGENLGWPAAKVQDMRTEFQAALMAAPGLSMATDKPVNTCELPRQMQEWLALVSEKGEVKGSLEYARRTGVNIEQLKADHLRRMAVTTASQQAAAASAPERL